MAKAKFTYTFRRYEKKYYVTAEQADALLQRIGDRMKPDEYGETVICNLYYDTPDYLLIRRSLDKPLYKEKLRLRCYGVPTLDSPVFLELKKKINGVGIKRRAKLPLRDIEAYLETGVHPSGLSYMDEQVLREIDYYRSHEAVYPKLYVSYLRNAYHGKNDPSFRVTFDFDILTRRHDLYLEHGRYGEPILSPGKTVMEVKFRGAVPLWFCRVMSDFGLSFHTFSKCGTDFKLYTHEKALALSDEERYLRLIH